MQTIILFVGLALCVMALLQFGFWTAQGLTLLKENRNQFELSKELLNRQIREQRELAQLKPQQPIAEPLNKPTSVGSDGNWKGFRWFRVAKLTNETSVCTSVYLEPEDGKPIVGFQPGQHLTFKFLIPGESKPVVRCYSLSEAPNNEYYRISVKQMAPPRDQPEAPSGKASTFINTTLQVGDRIEVKAPAGHFVLDENSNLPVVMLAGGIGITPMASITNHLINQNSNRLMLLLYGVQNGADQAFKSHFKEIAEQHSNFHCIYCYSSPDATDEYGADYQVKGFASVDLLKKVLPNQKAQFYLCGPPPFMESLYNGLLDWGVDESQVFYEAFGPASIGKTKKKTESSTETSTAPKITFAASNVSAAWNSNVDSLLELAEASNVNLDYGCRAGSCGTCATDILKGKVKYPDPDAVDCEPGKCLTCIAQPDGDVELDA